MYTILYLGNEEEDEEEEDEVDSVLLASSDAQETPSGTADNTDDKTDKRQSSFIDESLITESPTSPKCSALFRNKASMYYFFDALHGHLIDVVM